MKRYDNITQRALCALLALVLCLGATGAALADGREIDSAFFQCAHWKPEDVDVSGVEEIGGRLIGVVRLPATNRYGLPAAEVRVDCPVPADFTDAQRATLTVAHKRITRKQLLAAMKALGWKPEEGEGYAYNDGRTFVVSYVADRDLDSYFWWDSAGRAGSAPDPAYEAEYARAAEAARRLIEYFGGAVCEDVLHVTRRDAEHLIRSQTGSSNGAALTESARTSFDDFERKSGRDAREYTMVSGLYELNGLPVMDQYYWRDGKDWMGAQSSFQAAVKDDGTIGHAEIDGLPEIISAEPLDLPALDWRALLRQAVAYLCIGNANAEDQRFEEGTVYAARSVLTELKPCWVGNTYDTLVPGWYCLTEERVLRDGSLCAVWAQYGDAQTLMTLGQ